MPENPTRQHTAVTYLLDTIESLLAATRELQSIAPKYNPLPDLDDLSLAAAEDLAERAVAEAVTRSVVIAPAAADNGTVPTALNSSRDLDDLVTAAIAEPRAWHPAILTDAQQTQEGFRAVADRLKYVARVRGVRLSIRRWLDDGDPGDCVNVQLASASQNKVDTDAK